MNDALQNARFPERPRGQLLRTLALVRARVVSQDGKVFDWAVPDCERSNRQRSEERIVEGSCDAIQQRLA